MRMRCVEKKKQRAEKSKKEVEKIGEKQNKYTYTNGEEYGSE
jgi:uncharacterized protein with GYD domain